MRGSSGSKAVLITLLALAIVLIPNHLPNVAAPGTAQPAIFFFHSQITKTLNTITSAFWANTTQAWSGTAQTDQRTVSSSTPGIWHYYSQPGLAGNVTFTGPLTFVLYFVSSSGTGGGTLITSSLNQTGVRTAFFSRNWTTPARQVTLRTSLFDALGLYDVASARANLTSPAGSTLLSNSPLTRVLGSAQNYTGSWSLNWTYSSNTLSGIYGSRLAMTDNSGVSAALSLSYTIFATWLDRKSVV